MKRECKTLALLSAALLLVGCNDSSSSSIPSEGSEGESSSQITDSTSSPDASDTTDTDEGEKYVIRPSWDSSIIDASVDKTEAKEGETVTITINGATGATITQVIVKGSTDTVLTSEDGVTYTFIMPNQSVRIIILYEVAGEITLVGDFSAALTLNEETGVYEAKGVKVSGQEDMAAFSYQVEGEDGTKTKLDVSSLDETKTFANVTFTYSSSTNPAEQNLQIATGCTYDFYYDPSAARPCYVKRVSVDALPDSVDSLYTLFDGSVRSESTISTPNLTGMSLQIDDGTNNRTLTMAEYEGNVKYVNVHDNKANRDYPVYKQIDEEANQLIIVDAYTPNMGNDDATRPSRRSNSAYSARYDIDETVEDARFTRTLEEARKEYNTIPHQMSEIEYEFMYAYRVGTSSESDDSVSYSNIAIESTQKANGFTTTINSTVEHSISASTYVDERHDGIVYDVTLTFSVKGELTAIEYTETTYAEDEWDFVSHAPITGMPGTITKTIDGTYTYAGAKKESLPSGFDLSQYFISEFDSIRFYNPDSGQPDDGTTNWLHYNDKVAIAPADDEETLENVTVSYSPSTALDLWTYAPTETSDSTVIAKKASDGFNEMTCVGIGEATVTFTNHTASTGVREEVDINVGATTKWFSFSLNGTTNGMVVDTAHANIVAGTTETYDVIVTPSSAPADFKAIVDPTYEDILKVDSTAGGQLVLTAEDDPSITAPTEVAIRIYSDQWMDTTVITDALYIYITIIPSDYSLAGTWESLDEYYETTIVFTDDAYEGEYNEDYYTAPKTGTIVDIWSGNTDTYHFYYEYDGGILRAKVYDMETTDPNGFEFTINDITLDFVFDISNNQVGLCMYYTLAAENEWVAEDYAIVGSFDDEGYFSYTMFAKAE